MVHVFRGKSVLMGSLWVLILTGVEKVLTEDNCGAERKINGFTPKCHVGRNGETAPVAV